MSSFGNRDIPLTLAFIGTLLVNVPQLWKTWKTKDVRAFSVYTMAMRILINVCWIIYGIMLSDILITIMSIEVMVCELILLLFKHIYSTKQDKAADVQVA